VIAMPNLPDHIRAVLLDPWFCACALGAIEMPELLENLDRLWGTNLCRRGSGLELAIDQGAGRTDDDMRKFIEFVYEYIYTRVQPGSL